jgi:hypothetical protein
VMEKYSNSPSLLCDRLPDWIPVFERSCIRHRKVADIVAVRRPFRQLARLKIRRKGPKT